MEAIMRWLSSSRLTGPLMRAGVRRAVGLARAAESRTARLAPLHGRFDLELLGHKISMASAGDDHYVDQIYFGHRWEPGKTRVLAALAPASQGDILDVGANTGVFTLLMARAAPAHQITSFEPHPANFRRLRANVAASQLPNVHLQNLAVGSQAGMISFTVPADGRICHFSSASGSFTEALGTVGVTSIDVGCVTLDSLLRQGMWRRVGLIKIDVECLELQVLLGAQEVIGKFHPVIVAEVYDPEVLSACNPAAAADLGPGNLAAIEELMADHGYSYYLVGEAGLLRVSSLATSLSAPAKFLFSRTRTPARYLPLSAAGRLAEPARATPGP